MIIIEQIENGERERRYSDKNMKPYPYFMERLHALSTLYSSDHVYILYFISQIPRIITENSSFLPFSAGSLNSGCVSDPHVLSPAIPSCPSDALTTV